MNSISYIISVIRFYQQNRYIFNTYIVSKANDVETNFVSII